MRYTLFIILFCLALVSCKKKDTKPVAEQYKIEGVQEVSLGQMDTTTLSLEILHDGKQAQNVVLSIDSLPEGVYASFSDSSNVPPFTTRLTIISSYAFSGTYDANVRMKLHDGSMARSDLKVVINEPHCMEKVLGVFTGISDCDGNKYTIHIRKGKSYPPTALVTGLPNTDNKEVPGSYSCASNSISDAYYSGRHVTSFHAFIIDNTNIDVYYRYTQADSVSTCMMKLKRN